MSPKLETVLQKLADREFRTVVQVISADKVELRLCPRIGEFNDFPYLKVQLTVAEIENGFLEDADEFTKA